MTARPASLVRSGCGLGAAGAFLLTACLATLLALGGCDREPAKTDAPGHGAAAATNPSTGATRPVAQAAAPARPVTMVARPPAPKPTSPLPSSAACVTPECHTTFATSPQIHAPVAEKACDTCHAADIGGHRYPLKRGDVDATCGFCHAVSGKQEHQHAALQQGCTACHDPHASQAKFLLAAPNVEMLCTNCHQASLKRFAHRPFLQGDCTMCHQPHEADNPALLRGGPVPNHCFQCHDDLRQEMTTSVDVHEPAASNCSACHEPHTSDNAALLAKPIDQTCFGCHGEVRDQMAAKAVQHGALKDHRGCAACHDPHAADGALLMKGRMSDNCLTCHAGDMKTADGRVLAGMKKPLNDSKYLHGAIKLGDCSACHAGHAADWPMLLTGAFPASSYARFEVEKYGLCFENCHSPQMVLTPATTSLTNFRNGSENLHYAHVNRDEKGRSCRTCHAVHGSDLPNHMAAEVPFERSGWAMPVGFEKSDDGGRCAPGCHVPRSYSRSASAGPAVAPPPPPPPPPTTQQTASSGGSR